MFRGNDRTARAFKQGLKNIDEKKERKEVFDSFHDEDKEETNSLKITRRKLPRCSEKQRQTLLALLFNVYYFEKFFYFIRKERKEEFEYRKKFRRSKSSYRRRRVRELACMAA